MTFTQPTPDSLSTLQAVARFAFRSAESVIASLPAEEVIAPQTIHVVNERITHVSAFPTSELVEDGELIDAICADAYQQRPEFIVSLRSTIQGDREIADLRCFDRRGRTLGASFEFQRSETGAARITSVSYGASEDDGLCSALAGTMILIGARHTTAATG